MSEGDCLWAQRDHSPEISEGHPIIEIFRCDITIRQEVLALVAAIQDRHGRLAF